MTPNDLKVLFITCYSDSDRQFKGISNILKEITENKSSYWLRWKGGTVDLQLYGNINTVLISGHGAFKRPAVTDNLGNYFTADNIILPSKAFMYLLCCFQGRSSIIRQWADRLSLPRDRIFGCPSETETALSTIFFLHLLKNGTSVLRKSFMRWCGINQYLKPYFTRLRSIYRKTGGRPLETLKDFENIVDLSSFDDFIGIIHEFPRFLEALY